MPGLPIPAGPDALTPGWLTLALREGGSPPGLTVAGFTTETVGQEYGFTGRLARLHLRYGRADEQAPQSLVAKFPDPTAGQRLDAERLRGRYQRFEREVLFYQQIGADAGIRVPQLYYGNVDVAAGAFVLLLEDLAPGRQGDAFAGCSPEEAGIIVERVAKFHARWWEDPDLSRFEWLPAWSAAGRDAQARLQRSLPPFLTKYGHRVPKDILDLIDALSSCYGRLFEELSRPPTTMVHGDLHLDNIFFDVADAPLVVFDWQGVGRARGAVDLRDAVFDMPHGGTDAAVERELLRRYHDALMAHGVESYSFEELMRDSWLALLHRMGGYVNGYAAMDLDALTGRERQLVQAFFDEGRLFAALRAYDVAELIGELR